MNGLPTRAVVLLALVLVGGATVAVGTDGTGADAIRTSELVSQDTDVNARNVTMETLRLRNVTVTDAEFVRLTVRNASADGQNVTNRTYENVSVDRVEVNGTLTDVRFDNVTVRTEQLATALLGESGDQNVEMRLILDEAVLSNATVEGLLVQNATVASSSVEGLADETQTPAETTAEENATDGLNDPAVTAEGVAVGGGNLSLSGVSVGTDGAATDDESETETPDDVTETETPADEPETETPESGEETTTESDGVTNATAEVTVGDEKPVTTEEA